MAELERELNRTLRRADWRFLLENPRPEKSICFCGRGLARAVQAVSRVAVSEAEAGTCDLAVAANPVPRTLQATYRALQEGGAIYTEWYLPFSGLRRIQGQLEAAGFGEVSMYTPWPWPWLRSPKVWVPVGCKAARDYVARGPAQGWRLPVRIGFRALAIADRLFSRFGLSLPVCAVARKRGPAPALRPPESSLLLLTGGPRSISKAVGLVFRPGEATPQFVLKMSRTAEAASGLLREADTLQALHASSPTAVPGAPVISFAVRNTPVCIVGESALAGRQIGDLLCEGNYDELAAKGTRWLVELTGRPSMAGRANPASSIVESFERAYRDACEPGELHAARQIVDSLRYVPAACEHRDFSPWNVLIDAAGEPVVLDWESSEPNGVAGPDVIYFLSYMAFYRDGALRTGEYLRSYRSMLDPDTFTGSVFGKCFRSYARATGVHEDALPALRLLTWMIHAAPEHRRALEDGDASPAGLRRGLFFQLWREELVRAQRPALAGVTT